MTYRVFDDKFANTATVIIRVTDVNDNPPRFDPAEYVVEDIVEEDPFVSDDNPKFLIRVSHQTVPYLNKMLFPESVIPGFPVHLPYGRGSLNWL